MSVLSQYSESSRQCLGWNMARLEKCISANQMNMRFDRFGQLSGLAMWANVSEAVSHRLLRHGMDSLTPKEIDSGNETWLLELCALRGELPQLLSSLRDDWLRNAPQVTYFRVKNGRRIAKRLSRSDPSWFFRHAFAPSALEKNGVLQMAAGDGLHHAALEAQAAAQELGEVVRLARHVPGLSVLPLALALARLSRPSRLHQRRLYRDDAGHLCGYLSWAWVDAALARTGLPAPHALAAFQWNEGPCLVLCDAFATPQGLAQMQANLDKGLFEQEPLLLRTEPANGLPAQTIPMTRQHLQTLQTLSDHTSPVVDVLQHLQEQVRWPA